MNAAATHPRPQLEHLRDEAQRLLRDGLNGYDIAVALHVDVESLRRLLGIGFCDDCDE